MNANFEEIESTLFESLKVKYLVYLLQKLLYCIKKMCHAQQKPV